MKKTRFRKMTIKDIIKIVKYGFGKPIFGFKIIETSKLTKTKQ